MGDGPTDGAGTPGGSSAPGRDTKERVRLVAAGIGLVLLIAFAVANSTSTQVSFLVTSAHISVIWVILISAVLGVVVDRLVIMVRRRRRTRRR